jgi:hypothetical protein
MTLRKFLLLPLVISLAFFVYFSSAVRSSLVTLLETIHISTALVIAVAVSVALQLVGHIIRAYKARLVFGVAKESSTRFQFRALSVGYLFNMVLPFRLGELIRARVISGAMTISFGYALVLVLFERLIDALILGLIGLVLLALGWVNAPHLMSYIIGLICLAVVGLVMYGIVARQNDYMLKAWYGITRLFNDRLKTMLRFKAWTIIYGLQRTLRPWLLIRYVGLSVVSWLFYGLSLYVLAAYLLQNLSFSMHLRAAMAPYFGVGVPSGPASLGVFSKVVEKFTSQLNLGSDAALVYILLSWAVLVVPIACIGLVLLYAKTKETLWYDRPRAASAGSLMNKLYRTEDISHEMEAFLENYFAGNSLSRIVHNLELREDFKLIKYFKGGSDAITILALQDGKQVVKKIIPHEFEDRLKAQYDWLVANQRKPGIVRPLAERREADFYAIDLEFDPDNEMLYEFIHKNTLDESKRVMNDVWDILLSNVYGKLGKLKSHPAARDAYIKKHIFGCLEKAAAVDPELIRAAEQEKLIVNGVEYDNLYQIMEKIKHHPQAWRDIATYRETASVHGDVIVDNLLVSKRDRKVLIIDPAPDGNLIQGPVFDFGKNMQSLYCGYETLLRDEDPVYLENGNQINYRDQKSGKYTQLAQYISTELAPKHLSEGEQKAMLFHAAALYIRRLKHQVYYTPANVLKFYAVGVKTLNDFLAQYKD